jgi:hypothetical protein
MTFSIQYKTLFKVDILHLFFLNNGLKTYFSMSETDRAKQQDSYDINSFFSVIPTQETQQKLNGHNLVFRSINTGFAVWSKVTGINNDVPFIPLDDELCLTFLVKIKDSGFYNYTDLELKNLGKLNYFSNRRLLTEPLGFPLINKSGDNTVIGKTFALSAGSTTAEQKNLRSGEKIDLFGIVKLYMKGDLPILNITAADGKIVSPFKTFEMFFGNRKTIWRYIFRQNQLVKNKDDVKIEGSDPKVLITKSEQPLTQKGFISIELGKSELPNPGSQLIKPDTLNTKYYSEIYM